MPIVVNLFGSPGSGKSTGAAYIFSKLKMHGVNVELVTEYAKGKTWEHNREALANQAFIFGNQYFSISRCEKQVDVIITDSPLPLGLIYKTDRRLGGSFDRVVFDVFNSYDNVNYFVLRDKPYNPAGRNQTEQESTEISARIVLMLQKWGIKYETIRGNEEQYNTVVDAVLRLISNHDGTKQHVVDKQIKL